MDQRTPEPPRRSASPHRIRLGRWSVPLPGSRWGRMTLGGILVLGGLLGFLPILGFWMVPLGLMVLSIDIAAVRRRRRRWAVRWERRRRSRRAKTSQPVLKTR